MEQRAALDEATRALVVLAAAIAAGNEPRLDEAIHQARAASTPPRWVDELLLQSVLMTGWPRALVAAGRWRASVDAPADGAGLDLDYAAHERWSARGEALCREVYGDHYEQLRRNVRRLHPALDRWMVTEGYGRTLARAGLDAPRRELCVIAQTAVLATPRQLRSHLLGALNVGATPEAIDETLTAIASVASRDAMVLARQRWQVVRQAAGRAR
jgi:4-carboxymuconolactone decarboxylase